MQRRIVLISFILIFAAISSGRTDCRVRFVVEPVAYLTESAIYVTGNLPQLGEWQPDGLKLQLMADSSWQVSVDVQNGTLLEFKITRGSWQTEMVDPDGMELPNFNLVVNTDTTIRIVVYGWRDLSGAPTMLSNQRFRNKADQIELTENWKFQPGDNGAWGDENYDDRDWREIPTLLPADRVKGFNWSGVGWFRLHLQVDSSLLNLPLGMSLLQAGASEIYLNGKVLYRTGVIPTDSTEETASFNRNPMYIVFPEAGVNLLAVRYSNLGQRKLFGPEGWMGFRIVLFRDLDNIIAGRLFDVRMLSLYQLMFTLIPFTLAFLHLMIFIFNRKEVANFYYALSMTCFAIIAYTDFGFGFTDSPAEAQLLSRINFIAINAAVLFGLLTIYRSSTKKLPKTFYFFLAICSALVIWFFADFTPLLQTAFYIVLGMIAVELFRQGFRPIKEQNYIIGAGFIIMAISVILQVLINLEVIGSIGGNRNVYLYGVLALGISVSINLAKNFADINKQIIRQEREKREVEIERRLLEADNLRKTEELEEARKLQLSMLPSEIPVHPEYEIAMFMRTASEVGGDYYDFQLTPDDTLTIALGDATGHGIKAGIMVALVKSLFNTSANTFYLPDFFKLCTRMIKQMSLGNLYMAMMLVRLRRNKMVITIAGMPPVYLYRSSDHKIEEVILKALPLGGPGGLNYPQQSLDLNPGDTVLMMTDGYFELFNPVGEILDLDRVKSYFFASAEKPPDRIIADLIEKGDQWRKSAEQADDISFVVIRKR